MPSQFLYVAMNYGSMALVLAAMVVGVLLTKGTVRTLLAVALAVEVARFASVTIPASAFSSGDAPAFLYSLLQMLLTVATPLLLVAAAIVGARTVKAKDAAIAELVDKSTPTWQQPKHSPDPKLFVE
jgi:hypothetical protein